MKKVWLAGLSLVGVSTLSFLAGSIYQHRTSAEPSGVPARTVLYYRDAMNPSYTSRKPGKAPDGMDLQPVYAGHDSPTHNAMPPMGSDAVLVSLERQQMIGVRLRRGARSTTTSTLRTLGHVALDEDRVFPVSAAGDGWVTQILPGTATGNT